MFEKHVSVLVSFCCNYSGYFCGIRLDSKAASRIYKMVFAENDSMTYKWFNLSWLSRTQLSFKSRVTRKLDLWLCCSTWRTIINGIDWLRSPDTSQSHMSWRFLKNEEIKGELGSKDRRREGFVPKFYLGPGFWSNKQGRTVSLPMFPQKNVYIKVTCLRGCSVMLGKAKGWDPQQGRTLIVSQE